MTTDELERAHALVDALSHDEAIGNRGLAARAREVLAGPVSQARLTALLAALESANTESRTLRQLTSKFRVRRSAVERLLEADENGDCEPGTHKDPDNPLGDCIPDEPSPNVPRPRAPRDRVGANSKSMQLSDVIARLREGSRRIEAATEVIRKSVSEARLADREGAALLEALDASLRRRPPSLLDQIDELVGRKH